MIFPCIALLKGSIINDPELIEFLENPEKYNSIRLANFLKNGYGFTFWPGQLLHNQEEGGIEDEFIMLILYNTEEYRSLQIKGYNNKFADFFKPVEKKHE